MTATSSPTTTDSTRAAHSREKPTRRARRDRRRRAMVPYLFIAPFFVVFLVFMVVPMLFALNLSLYSSRLIGGTVFSGLDNYVRALSDPSFFGGLRRVAVFFVLQVPIMLALATVLALLLDSAVLRFKKVFRLGFFLPYAIPSIIAALMWGYLYGPTFGPLAQLGSMLDQGTPNLLSTFWMLPALANIVTWQWTGYNMIILYAALQAVPADLRGASLVDGATERQFAWHVKLPLIRPALVLVMVFSIIGSLQLFNEPAILQQIAPRTIHGAYTPNLYAYNLAFVGQEFNYSAAVSFLLGAVVFVLSYGFMIRANRRERKEGL
jgi:multiple sugar transport system permease protein